MTSKKVTLGKYEIGEGILCWAKSKEFGINLGDVRLIGGILMYAIEKSEGLWLFGIEPEVAWVPVGAVVAKSPEKLKAWVDIL